MAYVKGQPFLPQFADPATGLLMTSGTIEFYLTGTSTPTPYYTDSAGTAGGTSLTLNSGGKPATDIYFDTAVTYKIVVKNAAGTVLDAIDPYVADPGATLKADLAAAGGSGLVGRFGSVSGLLGITPVDGATFEVKGYHSGSLVGGGAFEYDASRAQTDHNGVNIIGKDAVFPTDWTNATQRATWYAGPGTGTGCFVRLRDDLSAFDAGAKGDGTTNDTEAGHAFADARPNSILPFLAGTYRGNFEFDKNTVVYGAGQKATVFKAFSSASPALKFGDSVALDAYFLGGKSFGIDGEGTAVEGLRIGSTGGATTTTYGKFHDIEIKGCVDNLVLDNAVGLDFNSIYSHDAVASNLTVSTNDIVTTANFTSSQFRQGVTGCSLLGGSLLRFKLCVIESNKDLGVHLSRQTDSGVRQIVFDTCWLENNAYSKSTAISGSIYIDMTSTQATAERPSYIKFLNTIISTAGTEPDVRLNRGNVVEFDSCTLTALDGTRLIANTGAGYCYAKLKNCGTINDSPKPSIYSSFPARVRSGTKWLGFAYEYDYEGKTYKNYSDASLVITSTATDLNVDGISTIIADTSAGSFDIASLANGHDGQIITIVKPSGVNTLTIKHNGTGTNKIFTGTAADVALTSRQGYAVIYYQGTWYDAGKQ